MTGSFQVARATAAHVALWAERLGIPVKFDPPGNLEPAFRWPEDSPPPRQVPKPDPELFG